MIIKDLSKVFKTLDGFELTISTMEKVKQDEKDEKGNLIHKKGSIKKGQKDMTMRDAMTNALLSDKQQVCKFCSRAGVDEQIPGEEKQRRGYLSMEIYKAKNEIDLDREDIELIRERIGEIYPSLIVVQAWKLLILPERKTS